MPTIEACVRVFTPSPCRPRSTSSPPEVRQVFIELGRTFGSESLAGECAPALDVYETDDALEITVDLPGVDAAAVRVIGKGDSVLIAGEKAARRARRESSFHLVERGYGRFARVVRLGRAVRHFQGARHARPRRAASLDPEDQRATRQSDSDRDRL